VKAAAGCESDAEERKGATPAVAQVQILVRDRKSVRVFRPTVVPSASSLSLLSSAAVAAPDPDSTGKDIGSGFIGFGSAPKRPKTDQCYKATVIKFS
jgi:hypothetical protein